MQRYLLFDSGCSRCRNLAAVVRRPILALGILFVVANVVTTYGLLRVARVSRIARWSAPLATALVLFNPLLGSAVGLEVALSAALLALLLMAAVEARPSSSASTRGSSACWGCRPGRPPGC